jgi:cytochrome c oxidase assembly factor 1
MRQSFLRPQHNLLLRNLYSRSQSTATHPIRPLIPPPAENSGPLMSRRPDRALPTLTNTALHTWLKTLPLFILAIVLSSLAIFNYQKSSSSTINSILYALRTNPQARELLGDEIYFASKTPWIRGELNQMHGRIDVRFWVKGTRGQGETRFRSQRKKRDGYFETGEWSLVMTDGTKVELLDTKGGGEDIFRKK